MDETLPVDLAKCCSQTDGYAQEESRIDRSSLVLLDYPIQEFTAWVFKNEGRSPEVTSERERSNCPRRIEFLCQRVFVFEPPTTLRRRLFSNVRHRQDRHLGAALSAAVESEVRPLADRLQHVVGILCHREHSTGQENELLVSHNEEGPFRNIAIAGNAIVNFGEVLSLDGTSSPSSGLKIVS